MCCYLWCLVTDKAFRLDRSKGVSRKSQHPPAVMVQGGQRFQVYLPSHAPLPSLVNMLDM